MSAQPQIVIVILTLNPALSVPSESAGWFPWHALNHRLDMAGLLASSKHFPTAIATDKLLLGFSVTDLAKALLIVKSELLRMGLLHIAEIGHVDNDGCIRLFHPYGTKPLHRHFLNPKSHPPLMMPMARPLIFLPLGIFAGSVGSLIHWSIPAGLLILTLGHFMWLGLRWQRISRWMKK